MEAVEVGNQSIANPEDNLLVFNLTTVHTSFDNNARLMSDVWVSIVLILMILSCVGCVCSCLLYYKFQKWKVTDDDEATDTNHGDLERRPSKEGPPSYTLVTGLPTYEQAVELARNSPAFSVNRLVVTNIPNELHLGNNETQVPAIPSSESNRSTKGVYPNAPLTPPSLSPPSQRAPTGSNHVVSEDVSEVVIHHIKI